MNTFKSSRAMRLAHLIYNATPDMTWRNCLKSAWSLIHFRDALHHGMYYFTYRKADGSVRRARGTLSQHLIPLCDVPKDPSPASAKKRSVSTFTYYDIDRKAWRSFSVTDFIAVQDRHLFDQPTIRPAKEKSIRRSRSFSAKEKRTKRENHAGGN